MQAGLRTALDRKLGNEVLLLLACARVQLTKGECAHIRRLAQQDIDWKGVLELAERHHVTPLLYRSLEVACPVDTPQAIRMALRQEVQVTLQGNLFLTQELVDLAARCREKDIDIIPYKGPLLTMALYGDLSLRAFSDLDILIHAYDVERVVHFLQSLGYQVIRPASLAQIEAADHASLTACLAAEAFWAYQAVVVHPQRGALVELHWRVAPSHVLPYTPPGLWADLEPVSVGGTTIHSLAMENLLWLLCVHGTKHNWTRLSWVCDLAELVRTQPDLDWEQVAALGKGLAIERRLYLGLLLANMLLDAPLPQVVEDKIQSSKEVQSLAQQTADRIFFPSLEGKRGGQLRRLPFQLRSLDRSTDRLRLLRQVGRLFLKKLRPSNWNDGDGDADE